MRRSGVVALVLISAVLAGPGAGALAVDSGLAPYQVIQCDAQGLGRLELGGSAQAAGRVEARVMAVQKETLGWTVLGPVTDGAWRGALADVPVGGPYRVELRVMAEDGSVVEQTAIHEVLVGDLWVLAGQSNMQGVGNRRDVEPPHPLVHTFSMSYEWRLAQEPLHTLAESPDVVHCKAETEEERQNQITGWRDGPKGAGLGLPFAREMVRRTGRPVGLVASAHGDTSMAQWDPALRDKGGESLYGSMYRQFKAAGGKVRGVIWYQGESDANAEASLVFREKFKGLVAAMRQDFGDPELLFYYVQIGRFVVQGFDEPSWHRIQVEQLAAETEIPHCGMVPAIDLELDDLIHVGTQGLKVLGSRLANLAERDLFAGTVKEGPRLDRVECASTPYGNQVRVVFRGVNGALGTAGRLAGFSISAGPDGEAIPCICDQEIDPEQPNTVILWISKFPENPHLWYGRGMDPYCNLVDSENMAGPVFGPVPVPQ